LQVEREEQEQAGDRTRTCSGREFLKRHPLGLDPHALIVGSGLGCADGSYWNFMETAAALTFGPTRLAVSPCCALVSAMTPLR
jgi:hypothetical protein